VPCRPGYPVGLPSHLRLRARVPHLVPAPHRRAGHAAERVRGLGPTQAGEPGAGNDTLRGAADDYRLRRGREQILAQAWLGGAVGRRRNGAGRPACEGVPGAMEDGRRAGRDTGAGEDDTESRDGPHAGVLPRAMEGGEGEVQGQEGGEILVLDV
jgi:hypothetical protein